MWIRWAEKKTLLTVDENLTSTFLFPTYLGRSKETLLAEYENLYPNVITGKIHNPGEK